MLINSPLSYDLCIDVPISHLFSLFSMCLNSVLNVKVLVGEGPSRGRGSFAFAAVDRLQL